jgi:hypothetical protein
MTTMKDLVADTRRLTYGSMSDQLNFLASDYVAASTSLVMTLDVTPITPGMILSSGLNVWYVTAVNTSTKTVTVYPGYDNSYTSLVTAGEPVMIRPRVTDWLLFNSVNDVIRAMSSSTYGLYKEGSWLDTVDSIWQTYDIPTVAQGMTNLVKAQIRYIGSPDLWLDLPANTVKVQRTENVIRLTRDYPAGTEFRFIYRAPFVTAPALSTDVVTYCGLTDSMVDIPPLGATAELLRSTESRRTQIHNQGDPRRADEVPTTSNAGIAREMQRRFEDRVSDEYVRLINRNPLKQMI